MSRNVSLLRRAIHFVQAGELQKARYLLISILKEDKSNEMAWKWLVETYPTTREKYLVYQKWQKEMPMSREAAQGLQQFSTVYFPAPQTKRLSQSLVEDAPPVWSLALIFILTFGLAFWIFTANQTAVAQTSPEPEPVSQSLTAVKQPASDASLEHTIIILENQNEGLNLEIQIVEGQNQQLIDENVSLSQEMATVTQQLLAAQNREENLSVEIGQLKQDVTELQTFIAEQIELPNVLIHDENLLFNFNRSNGQPLQFEVPYQMLVDTNKLSEKSHQFHRYQSVSAGNMTGSVLDCRFFIQSAIFEALMRDLNQEYSDKFLVMEQAWLIVSQVELTDSQLSETPQFPLETLINGGGVEDKAILLASMLKAAPVQWDVSLYYVDATSINIKHSPNDLMLKVVFDGHTFYLDPDGTTMNPYETVDGWEILIH
ncbi:MAG: hypothetical protein AAF490_21290 [Chloroflexota bacterium]